MKEEEKIISFLDSHEKEIVSFTQQLVRIRSENGNETAVAKVIQKKLRKYRIKSKLVGEEKERMSLVATIGKGKKSLILNGHLDTVKVSRPEKWKFPPFAGKISAGKLFGRGAVDMKGGLAAITFAAIALSKVKLCGKLSLACSSDEEGGNHTGIKYLLKNGLRGDACVIAEPYRKRIGIGNRGILRLQLTTEGKTGHTGRKRPEGINAVTKMAKVLLELQKTKFRFKRHAMFPKPKITPGTVIEGGTAMNIVPGECRALVDCRLIPGQTRKSSLEDIKKAIRRLQKNDKKLKIKIKVLAFEPAAFTSPKQEIVKVCARQVKKILGIKPTIVVSGGATDGNHMSIYRIPYLTMGADGANAHSENEYAKVSSISKAAKAIALSAFEFLRKPK